MEINALTFTQKVWPHMPRGIAAADPIFGGWFNLYNLGAKLRQKLRTIWTGAILFGT